MILTVALCYVLFVPLSPYFRASPISFSRSETVRSEALTGVIITSECSSKPRRGFNDERVVMSTRNRKIHLVGDK